jgi:hypothetical protein
MYFVISFIVGLVLLAFRAFAIKKLWLWFVIPTCMNINPITIGMAMGLSLLVSILQNWRSLTKEEMDNMKGYKQSDLFFVLFVNSMVQVVMIAFALGFGWFIHR